MKAEEVFRAFQAEVAAHRRLLAAIMGAVIAMLTFTLLAVLYRHH
jgi:hypothetical protein